jgi:hypothetical protein
MNITVTLEHEVLWDDWMHTFLYSLPWLQGGVVTQAERLPS